MVKLSTLKKVIWLSIVNLYLPLFIVFFIILMFQLFSIRSIIWNIKHDEYPVISVMGYLIPLAICLLTGLVGICKIYKENK